MLTCSPWLKPGEYVNGFSLRRMELTYFFVHLKVFLTHEDKDFQSWSLSAAIIPSHSGIQMKLVQKFAYVQLGVSPGWKLKMPLMRQSGSQAISKKMFASRATLLEPAVGLVRKRT